MTPSIRPFNKKHLIILIAIVFSLSMIHIIQKVWAGTSDVGTDNDPIVTKSYVDEAISNLSSRINDLEKSKPMIINSQNGTTQNYKFNVIELKSGQQILLGDSSELVLRTGSATAISGVGGGLIDLSSATGKDLTTGLHVTTNHLILSARNDGRGAKITSANAFLLVKGEYSIK